MSPAWALGQPRHGKQRWRKRNTSGRWQRRRTGTDEASQEQELKRVEWGKKRRLAATGRRKRPEL
eukprot:7883437-Alexandrium_andersonii.AAC.1